MSQTFSVEVFSLGTMLFTGEVVAVTSKNEFGPFDILDLHSNFISVIQEKLLLHLPDGSQKEFSISNGVLRCLETHVSVYVSALDEKLAQGTK